MITLNIDTSTVKTFMNLLFKNNIFDDFEVRGIDVLTFTKIEISGAFNKNYFDNDELKYEGKTFCTWKDLKPIVLNIIKGTKKPSYIKIVFSYPENIVSNIHINAKTLFLNIIFDKDIINCHTGVSQKDFLIEKSLDISWDEYVVNFYKSNNIPFMIL